ncbi:D-alanyl-lipoteichoic acid biosynthesis protein DltB [Macrococcus equipercicus]|uniref:Teichoic acid D-alanyltransferase n=1 Tax=Macrococcus equipercicus TaxID=69967 RepID=A0A9Q9BUK3_9STAP|nr:D-alanyl-lipoteichoic acid biosynthesis protein DltB [Macrococcus equipercicus]KAA1042530.1 D-alanyl-lipoteichoic acid biosynthesis protein DltB [Macrococcus equipercicus]UTH14391.1 D-alanyl-lipoteichoic acid biosynthesis protein DltB [Macrococcus equipercicus]
MIPYGDFSFFYIALLLLLPVIILGLLGRKYNGLNIAISFIMLLLIFKDPNKNLFGLSLLSYEMVSFIIYIFYQLLLIKLYLKIVKNHNTLTNFILIMAAVIAPLAVVKVFQSSWFGFGSYEVGQLPLKSIIGFLGISYIMFKSIQILMEIRDRRLKEINSYELIKFLSFFPTISSGPIDRYKRFQKDEHKPLTKERYRELLLKAVHYIMIGLLYKYILAYWVDQFIILSIDFSAASIWMKLVYMYGYSFYLFFDFAGYSLFAIAFSYLMSIETPPNFNAPFASKNIKDFWNRWHMTLSFWFRDMVYMRIVFFMTKKKLLKDAFMVSNIAFMLNFLIMGIWHGLEWHYIAYGLYHGVLFVSYGYYEKWRKKHPWKLPQAAVDILAVVITFHFVAFGFLIFSGKLF